MVKRYRAGAQRLCQNVGGRDRVLNGEIDADAADRRHRMGGIADDGRRLFLCVAQDVTDRKAYEDQILFLMHEVNHRAKNMLSLVQAVARQTAAREPEDFIGSFNERIRALAANQDLLVRNEWQGVDVEALARAQLAHLADLVGSN